MPPPGGYARRRGNRAGTRSAKNAGKRDATQELGGRHRLPAFALRLQQMPQRDSFIARLADRAAQRGDAPEIALSVRRSPHPLAHQIVNRMLRATLVARSTR